MTTPTAQTVVKAAKYVKKVVGKRRPPKIIPEPFLRTIIRAQMATAAPPLGPELGSRGVNVAAFCKDFNEKTKNINMGTLLPVEITVSPDRKYKLELLAPPGEYLLKMAAGIRRTKHAAEEVTGKLSVKHIYEIALLKSKEKDFIGVPLKDICQRLVDMCIEMGIAVQNEDIDPAEYKEFLDKRREIVKEQIKVEEEEAAQALLRTETKKP